MTTDYFVIVRKHDRAIFNGFRLSVGFCPVWVQPWEDEPVSITVFPSVESAEEATAHITESVEIAHLSDM